MTSSAIRRSFLDFFREKGHTIVPSSSLLPDSPNLLFTNAGMNQFVPIFLGQSACSYAPPRAADTQKCIRAGGKHNDLEDVGFDTYHHTFFEMLGNWSFGDYFKKEAIAWAWELVVGRWKFPASRIYATVYQPGPGDPASFDQEAHDEWARIFTAAGLDPAVHIVNGNKKDNFWMMGDTGPCGPCSELHVDLTPGPVELDAARQRAGRELVNRGDARCIEIWNLVFIQFNANPDGSFVDLPAKHVDTGMGFERVCSIIQGTKGLSDFSENAKISNYETDVFRPIFDELEKLTGKKYGSTLPASAQNLSEQEKVDVAFRVIADHIRTLSFSIADGIRPSNEGRGYVLRRILRRAVRYGRNLGLREAFLAKLVPVLGQTMGEIFPEVVGQAESIKTTLTQEEESFFRTLERGMSLFEQIIGSLAGQTTDREVVISDLDEIVLVDVRSGERTGREVSRPDRGQRIPGIVNDWQKITIEQQSDVGSFFEEHYGKRPMIKGEDAFMLYDTYGFPLDLTELMARERGLKVEVEGFNRLMDEQKTRAKAAQKKEVITVEGEELESLRPTAFYGFSELQSASLIVANDEGNLVVAETPFYAEMGGQVGDAGEVEVNEQVIPVANTVRSKSGKVFFHRLTLPLKAGAGTRVVLRVDAPRRARIEAHHSGTHLLNWALRKVLGNTIVQKGSYVGPDRLRFDFSHGAAVTAEQLAEIEALINAKVADDVPVTWEERPYAEVKGDPSILQFFGDKYGERVRVVSIGDFSRELCGGTHVRQSAQVGYFKILSEGAIAAGIRRIEAASGVALAERLHERLAKQDEQFAALKARKPDLAALPVFAGEETPEALWRHTEAREEILHRAGAEVAQFEKDAAKRAEADFQRRATAEAAELVGSARVVDNVPFLLHEVKDAPGAYLPVLAEALKTRWQGIALLAATEPGKVALLCAVAPAFAKKVQAGKIIQGIAPLVGGKGGGRPELAQGGGTQPEGLAAAFARAEELIRAALE
jgi:alanyl-tRNA synthetase